MDQTKKALFLSKNNIEYVTKRIYNIATGKGSRADFALFQDTVPLAMAQWPELLRVDKYEHILWDLQSDIDLLNKQFIEEHSKMNQDFEDYRAIVHLRTPLDYHRLSTTAPTDYYTQARAYGARDQLRFNPSKITAPRWYAESDDLKEAQEMEQRSMGYDNDSVESEVNKPYAKIDDQDQPYYGQQSRDSSTELLSTVWKTQPAKNINYKVNTVQTLKYN